VVVVVAIGLSIEMTVIRNNLSKFILFGLQLYFHSETGVTIFGKR
jgi:hypothetical protein